MDEEVSKETFDSMDIVTATTTASRTNHVRRRMIQNYLLILCDPNIDKTNQDFQSIFTRLQELNSNAQLFTERDECIDFLTDIEDVQASLVVEDTVVQRILPLIHDIPQLHGIYVYSRDEVPHEEYIENWVKMKGIYTTSASICDALRLNIRKCNQDSIAMSFIPPGQMTSTKTLNQLEPSFMYTQILKEILLEMEHDENAIKNFVTFCRAGKNSTVKYIDQFEKEYDDQQAIWWYTFTSFIYSELNYALRKLEANTIIKMGFFIRDLHKQIQQLYGQQVSCYEGKILTIYRGQSLSETDFAKLQENQGGLMSFNNFLSTSKDQDMSLFFATSSLTADGMVGILFIISIDPTVKSTPFADIYKFSNYGTEQEILFSMHTVFRIGEIKQLDNSSRLYQVELQLTAADDEQLRMLTKHIEKELTGQTGWERLGRLLMKIGQSEAAEELYNTLLQQTTNERDKVRYYHQLITIKNSQDDYKTAVRYYENLMEINKTTLIPKKLFPFNACINFGDICYQRGQYADALLAYQKALKIGQKSLPSNHPFLAASYKKIGGVYYKMGEYAKTLSLCEQALEIEQQTLPPNHPSIAVSYCNIAEVHKNMGEYAKALSLYEQGIEIKQQTLPPNHLWLAASFHNIGLMYKKMGEYAKALAFHEKAQIIEEEIRPPNHPSLALCYNNIGGVYFKMKEYAKALLFLEKTRIIEEEIRPPNHPSLVTLYNNIGGVYFEMKEYAKALSFLEKALAIREVILPSNHPLLATAYKNIGKIHNDMEKYAEALAFYEKELAIQKATLPPNDLSMANTYHNIGLAYKKMGMYAEALAFYEKALTIREALLPPNDLLLATSLNNIGLTYKTMGEYAKALSYNERSLEILQKTLSPDDFRIRSVKKSINIVKKKL